MRCRQGKGAARFTPQSPHARSWISPDSPLEEAGSEPSVPRDTPKFSAPAHVTCLTPCARTGRREREPTLRGCRPPPAEPMVRILFPPAESPQTIGSSAAERDLPSARDEPAAAPRDPETVWKSRCVAVEQQGVIADHCKPPRLRARPRLRPSRQHMLTLIKCVLLDGSGSLQCVDTAPQKLILRRLWLATMWQR